jgi:hypothetical protein
MSGLERLRGQSEILFSDGLNGWNGWNVWNSHRAQR